MRRALVLALLHLALLLELAGCSRNVVPDDEPEAASSATPKAIAAATPPSAPSTPEVGIAPERGMAPAEEFTSPSPVGSASEFQLVPAHTPAMPGGSAAGDAAPPSATAASAQVVAGSVAITPELAAKVAPGDVIWIVARPAVGGRPVAIKKLSPELPQDFQLSSADNPMGTAPFPERMLIKARVDKDGDPMSTSDGDLEGLVSDVVPGATGVRILVDSEIAYE